MKSSVFALLVSTLVCAPLAAQSNTGAGAEGPSTPSVLTAPDGAGGALDILYAPSQADDPAFRAAVAALTGGVVDYYDSGAGTPDATLMSQYDCLYVWTDNSHADNVLLGDRLADYVDAGGRVVLGAFTTFTSGNFLSGRIMQSGYSPVDSPAGTNHFASSDYAGDGTTAIHNGVTAYAAFYRDVLVLQGGGLQDGSYEDGEIATAYRPDFQVVYANGTGTNPPGQSSGDWPLLIANACGRGPYVAPLIQEVPALGTWGLAALLLALAGAATVMVRRRATRA